MRVPAHLDFAGSVRVLQVSEVGKKRYCRWYSQDFEIGETEVNVIHTEDQDRGCMGGAEDTN